MSCSLNSLKKGYIGDYTGDCHRAFKGDTRGLDHSSHSYIIFLLYSWGSLFGVPNKVPLL